MSVVTDVINDFIVAGRSDVRRVARQAVREQHCRDEQVSQGGDHPDRQAQGAGGQSESG